MERRIEQSDTVKFTVSVYSALDSVIHEKQLMDFKDPSEFAPMINWLFVELDFDRKRSVEACLEILWELMESSPQRYSKLLENNNLRALTDKEKEARDNK